YRPRRESRPTSKRLGWPSTASPRSSKAWRVGSAATTSHSAKRCRNCVSRSSRSAGAPTQVATKQATRADSVSRVSSRIEQYAMIGDTQTAALIGDDGSVDWMCAPRFDSGACFAALLGDENHGRWLIAPAAGGRATRRQYLDHTLVLETEFETPEGAVRIIDFMPIRDQSVDVVRIVEG